MSNTPASASHHFTIYTDGASKKNPGHAAAGVAIYRSGEQEPFITFSHYVGITTNNVAEYYALVMAGAWAYSYAHQHSVKPHLTMYADSELMVKQISGAYKIKNPLLKEHARAFFFYSTYFTFTLQHIYRSKNTVADRLANEAIEKHLNLSASSAQPSRTSS